MIVAAPNAQQQISRSVLGLMLLAAALALAPHILRLFPGLAAFGAVAVGWGAMVQAGRWRPPNTFIKGLLAGGGVVAVFSVWRHPFAIEPMIGLLLVAYQLKLIETTRRRDGFVIGFIAYFIIATHFLFDQSLLTASYALLALLVVTAALVAQTMSVTRLRARLIVMLALRVTLPAVPLAAAVFLLFPRVSPLWTVPIPAMARTGLAETLRPQDVVALSRNPDVAFRVAFAGVPPPVSERYWRALTYYDFIDESWQQGVPSGIAEDELIDWHRGHRHSDWAGAVLPTGDGFRYQVIMEPTDRSWLYSLGSASTSRADIGVTRDGRLISAEPIVSKFGYAANSTLGVPGDLPEWLRERALQLPRDGNLRARQLAVQLRLSNPTDTAFVRAVLNFYGHGGFAYSLTPDVIAGQNSIDGFLFGKRVGFCAHFAGSLVFLARAAGIPARMVGGYLGGEQNTLSDFVTVRQYDAHAWTELWFGAAQGWVRVDPTAVVAPERISRGVEALSDPQLSAFATPWGVRHMAGLALMFGALDSLEHQWNQWVVGYDADLQARMFAGWIGRNALRTTGLLLIGAVAATLGSYVLFVLVHAWWRRQRARSPVRGLENWGARLGCPRPLDETLTDYGARLKQVVPDKAALIDAVVEEACQMLYVDPDLKMRQRSLRTKLLRLRLLVGGSAVRLSGA